ncbi:hypothetical protein BCV71DRAFT_239429, partial [Rhizopus microsporus]
KECPHCHALNWIDQKAKDTFIEELYLGTMLQARISPAEALVLPTSVPERLSCTHFKDSLCQHNAVFVFTSLGCDCLAEDHASSNNNRGVLNAFQIHDTLCHYQDPLAPVEGREPSDVQRYIFDPSYAAELRQAQNVTLIWRSLESFQLCLSNAIPLHVYIAMRMKY